MFCSFFLAIVPGRATCARVTVEPRPAEERAAARLPEPFARWFAAKGWAPRAHQLELLSRAQGGQSVLLIAPTGAGKTLEATYTRPYQAHASIGPSCAVAQFDDGGVTVWTHTQGVYPDRAAIAQMPTFCIAQ